MGRLTAPCHRTSGLSHRTSSLSHRTSGTCVRPRPAVPAALLAALAVLGGLAACLADTEVGGVYSSPVRWDRARAPYLASSDVLVLDGGSVQIDAGVTVRFVPGAGLTVRGGRLIAAVSQRTGR